GGGGGGGVGGGAGGGGGGVVRQRVDAGPRLVRHAPVLGDPSELGLERPRLFVGEQPRGGEQQAGGPEDDRQEEAQQERSNWGRSRRVGAAHRAHLRREARRRS